MRISSITGVINIVTTLIAIAFVDRFGRKPLLLVGSVGMTLTLGTMAWLFASAPLDADGSPVLSGHARDRRARRGEPLRLRLRLLVGPDRLGPARRDVQQPHPRRGARAGRGGAVGRQLARDADLPGLSKIGLGLAYGLYTAAAALSFVLVWKFIRETKGRELEDM